MQAILEINGFQKVMEVSGKETIIKMWFQAPMKVMPYPMNLLKETVDAHIVLFELQPNFIGYFLHYKAHV